MNEQMSLGSQSRTSLTQQQPLSSLRLLRHHPLMPTLRRILSSSSQRLMLRRFTSRRLLLNLQQLLICSPSITSRSFSLQAQLLSSQQLCSSVNPHCSQQRMQISFSSAL